MSSRGTGAGPWGYLKRYRSRLWLGAAMLLATNAMSLMVPWLLGETIEALRGDSPSDDVPPLAMAMIGFAVLQAATRVVSRTALFNAARMAEYDLRSQVFSHLLTLDSAYYRSHSVGDVMSRLTSDVQTIRGMWGPGVLNIINSALLFSAALVLMLRIDPWLTMWALLPYPAMVVLGTLFGRRIYRASRGVQQELGLLSASIQEDLTGIQVIKNYSLEDQRASLFAARSDSLVDKNMGLTVARGQMIPVLTTVASLGTVAVLFVGGHAVVDERITLGEMVQFNAYLALLVWPTLAFGWMLSLLQRGMASWRRIEALLSTKPSIKDGSVSLPAETTRGDIEIKGLTIEIDGRRLLDDICLELEAGSVTAIVGRVGSGKSTLVEALPRLIDVPRGSVFIDGQDITELRLVDLRRAVGYAPQEAFLFSRTIAENIEFGAVRALGATDPKQCELPSSEPPALPVCRETSGRWPTASTPSSVNEASPCRAVSDRG